MNAQELYQIVKDWPEEAVPMRFRSWRIDPDWYGPKGPTRGLDEVEAVMMFESAGLRWLIENGLAVWQSEDDGMFRCGRWNATEVHEAPTLIQAISKAIESLNKGESQP